jgi:hypothetical protein
MRNRGLQPIPVLHGGEDIKWLHKMLDLGCDYVCIASSSIRNRGAYTRWFEHIWGHLVNYDGLPIVKAHALGLADYELLRRFPWASADSTSWVYSSQRSGKTTFPGGTSISLRNDGRSERHSPDARSLSELDEKELDALLAKEQIDKDAFCKPGQQATMLRSYVAAKYYLEMERKVREKHPVRFHPQGFTASYSNAPSVDVNPFKMYLVRNNNPVVLLPMLRAGVENALMSYFYLEPPKGVSSQQTVKHDGATFLKDLTKSTDPLTLLREHPVYSKSMTLLEAGLKC